VFISGLSPLFPYLSWFGIRILAVYRFGFKSSEEFVGVSKKKVFGVEGRPAKDREAAKYSLVLAGNL